MVQISELSICHKLLLNMSVVSYFCIACFIYTRKVAYKQDKIVVDQQLKLYLSLYIEHLNSRFRRRQPFN